MAIKKISSKITAKSLFFIFLSAIFLLSACTISTSDKPVFETDIHEGTDGLLMDFAKNLPPDDITDKTAFQIGIELRNKGTEGIKDGYLTLLNFYPEEMELKDDSKTKKFEIEGRTIYNQEGGYDLITYTVENKDLPVKQRQEANFLFKAVACYKYRTAASANVCIKPRNLGYASKEICEVEDISMPDGQGAPVAVTKIEQSLAPNIDDNGVTTYTGIYKILIENKGKGYITNMSLYEKPCTESFAKENVLKNENIKIVLSDKELSCTSLSNIKNTNTFFTVCTAELGQLNDAYITPLTVSIEYGYVSPEIEKTVFVKKIAQAAICQAEKCKENVEGVCGLYGGENAKATPSCGLNKKCCYESAERCSRDFGSIGYACRPKADCNAASILKNYCPGAEDTICCKSNP